jgi:hypothetical protein
LSASLNRGAGRKAKRKGMGRPAGLPLMAGGPSGRKDGKGKRGNGRGLEWTINCFNWRARWGEKKKGSRRGRVGFRATAAAGRQAGGIRKGRGERLTGGAQVSARAKQKEKREGEVGRHGEVRRAAGPFGLKGEPARFFFLFSFLFQTSF